MDSKILAYSGTELDYYAQEYQKGFAEMRQRQAESDARLKAKEDADHATQIKLYFNIGYSDGKTGKPISQEIVDYTNGTKKYSTDPEKTKSIIKSYNEGYQQGKALLGKGRGRKTRKINKVHKTRRHVRK